MKTATVEDLGRVPGAMVEAGRPYFSEVECACGCGNLVPNKLVDRGWTCLYNHKNNPGGKVRTRQLRGKVRAERRILEPVVIASLPATIHFLEAELDLVRRQLETKKAEAEALAPAIVALSLRERRLTDALVAVKNLVS